MNILSRLSGKAMVKTVPVEDFSLSLSNTIQRAATYQPIAYKSSAWENFFTIASMIWLVLALASILAMFILYGLTMTELKKAVLLRGDLYEGPMVNSPTVIGMLRPRIILPLDMDDKELSYILLHERIHIGRYDNLWRMIAILAACIHWFNPMSWVFLKLFLNDCELACDEGAIKKLNPEERKEYARTLLNYTDEDRTIFSTAFGSNKVKIRVMQVLSYRRLTWFSVICVILLMVCVAVLLLTNGMV
jgi:beta-lactamase regulating signal transducer with metallopeptidase domain